MRRIIFFSKNRIQRICLISVDKCRLVVKESYCFKDFMSIITVSNLSKRYIIGHDKQATGGLRCRTLRDSLTHLTRSAYQRLRHPLSPNRENTEMEVLKF